MDKKKSKWQRAIELQDYLEQNSFLDPDLDTIKHITHAPNMGYNAHIVKYKGVRILLYNIGNGHYKYGSIVSIFDILWAKIYKAYDNVRWNVH